MPLSQTDFSPILELGNNGSLRNLVITGLGKEWPLNVRRLHRKIEKQSNVSYHAVHKLVQQMLQEGMLKREKAGYMVNTEWVEGALGVVEKMRSSNGESKPSLTDFKEGETQTFVFENLATADSYRKELQKQYMSGPVPKHDFAGIYHHLKSPLIWVEKSIALVKHFWETGKSGYFLCAGETAPDEWCAEFYRNPRMFVKVGTKFAQASETNILDDFVIQLHIAPKVLSYIEESFSKAKDASELNRQEFFEKAYAMPSETKLIVTRNAEIAEQLRRQVIAHFANDKIAIFDVYGIVAGRFYMSEFCAFLAGKGLFREDDLKRMLHIVERYEKGAVKYAAFVKIYKRRYLHGIKGQKAAEVGKAGDEFAESIRERYSKVSMKLFYLALSYRRILATTRMPLEVVKPLQKIFPWEHIICSASEVRNGAFTGRLSVDMMQPGAQLAAIKKWLEENRISTKGSLAFGTHHRDIPYLELVETPIISVPESRLESMARKRGWVIVTDKNIPQSFEKIRAALKKA